MRLPRAFFLLVSKMAQLTSFFPPFLFYFFYLALVTEKRKSEAAEDADDEDADSYFQYFQLACECKHTKIIEIALDGVHTLIGKWRAPTHVPDCSQTSHSPPLSLSLSTTVPLTHPTHPRARLSPRRQGDFIPGHLALAA